MNADDEYIYFYDISDFMAKSAVISSILYFSDSNAATAEPFRDAGDGEFQYEQSAMSSRNILKQKLGARNLPQSCKDFFKKLPSDISPQWVLDTLSILAITDPTNINVAVTCFISEASAKRQGIYGWTVAELFEKGLPDHAPGEKIVGWSPPDSNVIFILPAYMSPQLVGHETLHKYFMADDEILQAYIFGAHSPEIGKPSDNITRELKANVSIPFLLHREDREK
jgi:hypothetical protein